MEHERSHQGGDFSRTSMTALLAVCMLVGVLGWEVVSFIQSRNQQLSVVAAAASQGSGAQASGTGAMDISTQAVLSGFGPLPGSSATTSVADIGPNVIGQLVANYIAAQQSGSYTPATGQQLATNMAPYVKAQVSYTPYTSAQIPTTNDLSYARMLQYRSDMQTALRPLLKNTQPELNIIGQYVDTKNPTYLVQLRTIASNYTQAAQNAAQVTVPQDAVSAHVAALNATQEFGAVLTSFADNADDPITSVALLRAYNQAEQDMFNSFNTLAQYYAGKTK